MNNAYQDFIKSDKAKKIFGFKKTRIFSTMNITFVIIIMGNHKEYHMMFSMSPRWETPVIEFFESKFKDKHMMPYGSPWYEKEIDDSPFILVGDVAYSMEDYARFSCINYLIHAVDQESIFMLKVPGSSPILKKMGVITGKGDKINIIPLYA